jgi:hypothetical protein
LLGEILSLLQGRDEALPAPLPYRQFIAQARSVPVAEHEAYFRRALGDIDEPTAPFGALDVQGDGGRVDEVRAAAAGRRLRAHPRRGTRGRGLACRAVPRCLRAGAGPLHGPRRCRLRHGAVRRLQGTHGADRVLGMFINTLPVRVTLGAADAPRWCAETRERLAELLEHEQASLALAQRCSGVSHVAAAVHRAAELPPPGRSPRARPARTPRGRACGSSPERSARTIRSR